jgi:hypothetical protein
MPESSRRWILCQYVQRGRRMKLRCLSVLALAIASPWASAQDQRESGTRVARGSFEVKLAPQGEGDKGDGSTLGRMSIVKEWRGGIEGISKGEMLTAMSDVQGSGVYVAVERVTGTVDGKRGSFALYHSGSMAKGVYDLSIRVAPDSGAGELKGIRGVMKIVIEGKNHFYEFAYTLAP